jgi:hypothetical protein
VQRQRVVFFTLVALLLIASAIAWQRLFEYNYTSLADLSASPSYLILFIAASFAVVLFAVWFVSLLIGIMTEWVKWRR